MSDWLAESRLRESDLEDETRLFPIPVLEEAARTFVGIAGSEALQRLAPYFLESAVLADWASCVRDASPTFEFSSIRRLFGEGSAFALTTIRENENSWKGRLVPLFDTHAKAEGGHVLEIALQRLAAYPSLFGGSFASIERGTNEFSLHWSFGDSRLPILSAALVLGAGAAGFALSKSFAVTAVTLAGGAAFAVMQRKKQDEVSQQRKQDLRLRTLERALALKEVVPDVETGQIEGTTIAGRYRIEEPMGVGATGVVYRAIQMEDGRKVAVKLLRAAAAHDQSAADRLRREAEALGLAWHPNVVEVLDHGKLPDGTSYLVMEHLEGETLDARLRREGPLLPTDLLPIAKQLSEALVAIHSAGVVHRDMKPANVFLLPALPGGELRVKVLDFGIARVEWEEMRITNSGSPIGTPGYMAPEQEMGGEVDARSDIYGVGAILFECLVGDRPIPVPAGVWASGEYDHIAVLGTLLEGVSEGWQSVIFRAMSPAPSERYGDAREMSAAIRSLGALSVRSMLARE